MQALRKSLAPAAARLAAKAAKPAVKFSPRFMSSLSEKGQSEEAKFFREQDEQKKAAIRAQLERVLSLDDGSDEKKEVIELLAHPTEKVEQSFFEKYGLDDWKVAVPVGLLVAIPSLGNEVIVLNAETQLVAAFLIFIATMYQQTGTIIAKSLDEQRDAVLNQLKKVDDSLLVEINATIEANQRVLDLEEDVSSIFTLVDELSVAQADILNYNGEVKYRDAIQRKLDALIALEETAFSGIRHRLVSSVTGNVIKTFKDDKKAKEAALAQAIAVITGGGGELGKDVVGDIFVTAIKGYRESYSKLPPGGDDIIVQLEKDIAQVVTAPQVDYEGGNVYVTHPILN